MATRTSKIFEAELEMDRRLQPEELLNLEGSNTIRPYTAGIQEHRSSIATIILYTSNGGGEKKELENNYLANLNLNIENIIPNAYNYDKVKSVDIPSGKIALLSLDDKEAGNYYGVFNNFSIMSVSEGQGENLKLHQSFANGWSAFFFGSKPLIYNFTGIFLDTKDYPYYQEFLVAYEKYLSGRKCVENKMQLKMFYDGKLIDGYMVQINTSFTSESPHVKSFGFQILVKRFGWLRMNLVPRYSKNTQEIVYEEGLNAMSNVARLGGNKNTRE